MKTSLILCCVLVSQLVFAATKTWTGNTSTDWATATNWSGNSLPASGDDIIIPTSPAGGRMPAISADYTVGSITIQTGATLTHTNGVLSVIGGSLNVSGTYAISSGTLLTDATITILSGGLITQTGGTIHLANAIGTTPSDHVVISANGNYSLSAGILDVRDLTTTAGSPNGTFTQSGGSVYLYHDFRNRGNYTAFAGTIYFAGNAGAGSFPVEVTSSNTQFYHVVINASVDPKIDNEAVSFNVAGNWTNNSSGLDFSGKATTVVFNGSDAQTLGGSQTATFRNLTIDKPSGTLTLTASQSLNNGNLTVSSGTLDLDTYTLNRNSSGGTLSVANGSTLQLGANSGGQTGSNFPLNFSSVSLGATSTVRYNGTDAITQTIYAGATYGHLSLTKGAGSGTASKITTANITVNGDLTIGSNALLTPGAANTVGGTGTLTGSGTAQVTRTTATADFNTQYPISNKTLSSLTVDYYATAAQTVNAHNYFNLTISGARTTSSVTLASSGTIGISGTFTPSATFSSGTYVLTGSTVDFNGASAQNIPAFTFNNLTLSGSAKTATGIVQVNAAFTLGSGVVLTTTAANYLHIRDNGTASGATATAYVSGPVRKTGNDAFTFPVGKAGTGYMSIAISAPGSVTDAFTAEYMRSPAATLGGISSPGLNFVSNCDYWTLDRSNGTATVDVTLSWNGFSNCNTAAYVTHLPTLVVAHYNGATWDSHGASSTTGNVSAGTVTRTGVSNFSPFALGSTGGTSNPLSTAALQVNAFDQGALPVIQWTHINETGIRSYEVERAGSSGNFVPLYSTPARNNNGTMEQYSWTDNRPANGQVLYRVKATGLDGTYLYSQTIKISKPGSNLFLLYPNPVTNGKINIHTGTFHPGTYEVQVCDLTGAIVLKTSFRQATGNGDQQIQLPATAKPGTYSLRVTGIGLSQVKTFLLQ